ncbi:MAG TPA: DUF922 domain-containing protein [Dehalococcoidia bacterium]|nr:DUF922 domain-containing protein [Dehalococcoidia bacterium]
MNAVQVTITVLFLLLLGGAAIAVFAFGDDPTSPSIQAPPAILATTSASPQASPTVEPAATTPAEATIPPPDRTSCDEIRGTPYRSNAERQFFLESCVVQPTATSQQPSVDLPGSTIESSGDCVTSIEIVTSRSDETYNVTGTDLDAIAASLEASAPQIDGSSAFGLTEYSYGLDGSFCLNDSNTCSFGEITIAAEVIVTLPNLTTVGQLGPEVAQVWSSYADQVSIHEGRHVRILEEGLEDIRRQLLLIGEKPDCDALNHEIDKVWALGNGQMEQRQRAFHIADATGSGGLVVQ